MNIGSTKNKKNITSNSLFFLRNLLENLISRRDSYDLRANFLLTISCVVFMISIGNLLDSKISRGVSGHFIMCLASLGSAIFSLLTLKPPKFFAAFKKENASLMHHTNIDKFNYEEISRRLKTIIKDEDKMINQYIMAIYNVTEKSVMRKRKFLILSGNLLVLGLFFCLVFIFYLP